MGLGKHRKSEEVFQGAGVWCFDEEIIGSPRGEAKSGDFGTIFICGELSFRDRFAKYSCGGGYSARRATFRPGRCLRGLRGQSQITDIDGWAGVR